MLPFGVTLDFIPWPSSLIPSLFSYPNRNIKSLSEIQIVQVACGYYHSLALSKGKQDSSEVLCSFLPGNSEVFNIPLHWNLNLKNKFMNQGSVGYSANFFSCAFLIFFFFNNILLAGNFLF